MRKGTRPGSHFAAAAAGAVDDGGRASEPAQADGALNTFDDWSAREFAEFKVTSIRP
jgi:hypothetical protein